MPIYTKHLPVLALCWTESWLMTIFLFHTMKESEYIFPKTPPRFTSEINTNPLQTWQIPSHQLIRGVHDSTAICYCPRKKILQSCNEMINRQCKSFFTKLMLLMLCRCLLMTVLSENKPSSSNDLNNFKKNTLNWTRGSRDLSQCHWR